MVIDTKTEASTLRKTITFVIIVYTLSVLITWRFVTLDVAVKSFVYGILSLFFLIFFWFQYKLKYTYFYFSNNGSNLVFKFYSLQPFFGKARTIEIPKKNFMKSNIEASFFGKRDSLILFQKTPRGVAKYPPISLTLLNKKQKKELQKALKIEN